MARIFFKAHGAGVGGAAAALLALSTLAGCASIKEAQMALPAPLAAATPEPIQGIGAGRSGDFTIGGQRGSFTRGRDRLSIFEVLSFDRASTRYSLSGGDGSSGRDVNAACRGRQTTATLGIVSAQSQPFSFECQWSGAQTAAMQLAAPSIAPGSRAERNGKFTAGGVTLELRSVHQVQGSPLPLQAPIGYVLTHQSQPVGAIELNGTTLRLWRPAAGSALHEPVTWAALALALLWDPAGATP